MPLLKMLIGLPIVVVVLVFAFVNNDLAVFSLWPLAFEVTVSLSVAIVFLIAFGFFLGSFFSWMSYAPVRKALRQHKKQCKKLNKEQKKLVREMEGLHVDLENIKAAQPAKPTLGARIKSWFSIKKKTDEENK